MIVNSLIEGIISNNALMKLRKSHNIMGNILAFANMLGDGSPLGLQPMTAEDTISHTGPGDI